MKQEIKVILLRLSLGLVAGCLVVTATINFVGYASSPTDENWFRDSPSRLIILEHLQSSVHAFINKEESLEPGDLILSVGGENTTTLASFQNALSSLNQNEVKIVFYRPHEKRECISTVLKSDLIEAQFKELPHTVLVFDITSNGASDRAGMKIGDLIFSINGFSFLNANQADLIMRQGGAGRSVVYQVIRGNEVVQLNVTLSTWGVSTSKFLIWLFGVLTILLGFMIGYRAYQASNALMISFALMLVGFSTAVMEMLRGSSFIHIPFLPFSQLIALCFAMGFAMLSDARRRFPIEKRGFVNQFKWHDSVPYVLALIPVFILSGNTYLVCTFMMSVYLVTNFVEHFSKSAKETQGYSEMSRVIILAAIVSFLTLLTALFLSAIYPTAIDYGILMISVIPIAHIYVIGKYRLFDMDLRIKRTIQYSLISTALYVAIIYLLVLSMVSLLNLPISFPNVKLTVSYIEVSNERSEVVEKFVLMALAIVLAYVVWKMQQTLQRWIDKRYFRDGYDYRRASNELSDTLSKTTLTLNELSLNITKKIAELMNLRAVGAILKPNASHEGSIEGVGIALLDWQGVFISHYATLFAMINQAPNNSRFAVDALPISIRGVFQRARLQFIIPIRSQEKLIGAFFIGEKLSEEAFQQEDFLFLMAASRQASVAIENAVLHEALTEQERIKHELDIARRIQLSSLPIFPPLIKGLEISGNSIPAQEVGGDYFDYLNGKEHEMMIVVGDVSGKGTSAALYMSRVQGMLRSLHSFNLSPRELFLRTNTLLISDLNKNSFVTAIGALFSTQERKLWISRAGHLPLIHFCSVEKRIKLIRPKGIGLAIVGGKTFEENLGEVNVAYAEGDVFVFVSDGITEARNPLGEEFGFERLCQLTESHFSFSAEEIKEAILLTAKQFSSGAPQFDDQTVVVVKAV